MSIQEAIMQLRECQQERDSMLEGKRIADALMAEGSQRIEELRQERDSLAAQLAEAKRQNAEMAAAIAAKDRRLTDLLDLLSFGQGSSRKENKAREALALKPADALAPVRAALNHLYIVSTNPTKDGRYLRNDDRKIIKEALKSIGAETP